MIAPHGVDTVRNDDTLGQRDKGVIKCFERLLAVDFASALERAQALFLLRIDAHKRVACRVKVLDEVSQMTALRGPGTCLTARSHLGDLTAGTTKSIKNAAHHAGADCTVVFVERVGDLSGGQIGLHKVVTPGGASRAMVDGALHLLDPVGVFGFGFLAPPARLAHPRPSGIIGQWLALSHAVSDGLGVTPEPPSHVLDAAVAQFDGCKGGNPSAVFCREALMVVT
jgi:hypothetical protein